MSLNRILALGCLIAQVATLAQAEWTMTWRAPHGFNRPDGLPIFAGETGGYTAQLIWSPGPAPADRSSPAWRPGPLGEANPASGQEILATVVNIYDDIFIGENGALRGQSFALPDPERGGYVFARVYNVGSDNPANAAAFANYFESRLIAVGSTSDFNINTPGTLDPDLLNLPPPPRFGIDSVGLDGSGNLEIRFFGEIGTAYQLEYTIDLVDPDWTAIGEPVNGLGNDTAIELSDPEWLVDAKGFYRLIEL